MSFDSSTGWSHLTPNKLSQYFKPVTGKSDDLAERLRDAGIPFCLEAYGGVLAKCSMGVLWTALSGCEATFSTDEVQHGTEEHYFSVSEMGFNLTPKHNGQKLNNVLSRMCYQVKDGKTWVPTEAGKEFCKSYKYNNARIPGREEVLDYLKWKYEIISIVQEYLNNNIKKAQ